MVQRATSEIYPYRFIEDPFSDPYFDQWAALEVAFDELGHTTQTFQGVRAWLHAIRDGLDDRTTPATRDRYRKILAAVTVLCGPPCYVREKTPEEIDDEVAYVEETLAGLVGPDPQLVTDCVLWWRCKLERRPHRLGSSRTNTVSALMRKARFGSPNQTIIIFPTWGPGVGDYEPERHPVVGAQRAQYRR